MLRDQSDAVKLLEKYNYRVDVAVDAFFDGEFTVSETDHASSAEQAQALFDKYKDDDEDEIGVDGTINFLKDLDLELEEPVVLALAYEFKAPEVGRWSKAGWVDGMRGLGCGTMNDLKGAVNTMKQKLGSDHDYFRTVYTFTFSFGLSEGQRSLRRFILCLPSVSCSDEHSSFRLALNKVCWDDKDPLPGKTNTQPCGSTIYDLKIRRE
ncbi:Scaffold-type E3 ligase [Tulasnella sp. 427]|nr:Scaffold-type E3 ligase [Tulasnella sp. 427]